MGGVSPLSGERISIPISIPVQDYSAGVGSDADITIEYNFRGRYFHGDITIHSISETRDGPLRNEIETIVETQAKAEAAKTLVEIEKLRHEFDSAGVLPAELNKRISDLIDIERFSPEAGAYFSVGAQPANLAAMSRVSVANPRYTTPSAGTLFVAIPQPGDFVLKNITTDADVDLSNVVSSFFANGHSHFLYNVGSQVADAVFEVEDRTVDRVALWAHQIEALSAELTALKASQSGALDDIPQDVLEVLKNDVSVDVHDDVTVVPSDFNIGLGTPRDEQSIARQQGTQASNVSDRFDQRDFKQSILSPEAGLHARRVCTAGRSEFIRRTGRWLN